MSEGIKAAIIFVVAFANCYLCYRIGVVDGCNQERLMRQRIKSIQYDLQRKRQAAR